MMIAKGGPVDPLHPLFPDAAGSVVSKARMTASLVAAAQLAAGLAH